MLSRLSGIVAVLFLTSAAAVRGDDVNSGPAAGDKPAALKAHAITGDSKGKEVDLAAERKDKPTLFVFVHHFDRPVGRFLKTLDGEMKKSHDDFHVVAVWLTDDQDKLKDHLPRVQESLGFEATSLAVSSDGKAGPNNWGLNDQAHVTVVVATKGKVTKSLGFVSTNEKDVRPVLEAVQKAKDNK